MNKFKGQSCRLCFLDTKNRVPAKLKGNVYVGLCRRPRVMAGFSKGHVSLRSPKGAAIARANELKNIRLTEAFDWYQTS
jgi:hypothetical protein